MLLPPLDTALTKAQASSARIDALINTVLQPGAWQSFGLSAGWATPSGRITPGWRQLPSGNIEIKGAVEFTASGGAGVTAGGQQITTTGTIPAAYRPAVQPNFPVIVFNTDGGHVTLGSTYLSPWLGVTPGGNLYVYGLSMANTSGYKCGFEFHGEYSISNP